MRIAFYAPMKAPDAPTPSGDRQMARLLVAALKELGHEVAIASRLCSWRPTPNTATDKALAAGAEAEVAAIRAAPANTAPQLWFTYHLYHKAPDLIGPAVSRALGIPYVVFEASRAAKRSRDAWGARFRMADAALAAAHAVAAVHAGDAEGLAAVVPDVRLTTVAPFIDARPFIPHAAPRPPGRTPRLLTVAMMRPGDKLDSYRVLADSLARLRDRAWTLDVVGDGPARAEVARLFADAGLGGRVQLAGALGSAGLPAAYGDADLFVWPAIREAYGMVFLEAQAAGLPVVGARRPGIEAIVRDGATGLLAPEGNAEAFAEAIAVFLDNTARIATMGPEAAAHVVRNHDLPAGARALAGLIETAQAASRAAGQTGGQAGGRAADEAS